MTRRRDIRQSRRPDHWGWIPELSDQALTAVGGITLELLRNGEGWVHRRVETLTFVDAGVVRRHLSVDFTLPKHLPTPLSLPNGDPVHFVPVTMLPQDPGPMRYDVRGEQGEALSLLAERECQRITASALGESARRVLLRGDLAKELDGRLGRALSYIPFLIYPVAVGLARAVLVPYSTEWRELDASVEAREQLRADESFRDFLSLVTGNSVALVPLVGAAGRHRVVKLAYEEAVDQGGLTAPSVKVSRARRWVEGRVVRPWAPEHASVTAAIIGSAESHHVQIVIPPNLEITDATLESRRPYEAILPLLEEDKDLPSPFYKASQSGFLARAHLYLPSAHQLTSGSVHIDVRAERRGLLTGAMIASFVIVVVLFGYWQAINNLINQSSSATAVLLLAPGLATAYLARPGEHALARKLLAFPRAMLTASTFMVFLAAGAILGWGPGNPPSVIEPIIVHGKLATFVIRAVRGRVANDDLTLALMLLFILSCISFALIALSRMLPRPKNRGGSI